MPSLLVKCMWEPSMVAVESEALAIAEPALLPGKPNPVPWKKGCLLRLVFLDPFHQPENDSGCKANERLFSSFHFNFYPFADFNWCLKSLYEKLVPGWCSQLPSVYLSPFSWAIVSSRLETTDSVNTFQKKSKKPFICTCWRHKNHSTVMIYLFSLSPAL